MIKRVKIHGYKSIKDLDIELQPLTVIMGPNAVGKSNFLDALQLLSRLGTSKTIDKAFEPPYRGEPLESFTFDNKGINGLLGKDKATISFEIDVELSDSIIDKTNLQVLQMKGNSKLVDDFTKYVNDKENVVKPSELPITNNKLRYSLDIEINPKSGIIRVTNEYLAALTKQMQPQKGRQPYIDKTDKDKLTLRMEGQSHPKYYDIGMNYTILSSKLYPPHHPHMLAMYNELESWHFFYFEPREKMRSPNPVKEVNNIGLMGDNIASYLNTLKAKDDKQYKTIIKSLTTIIPSIKNIELSVNNNGNVDLNIYEGDTPIPISVISEGTLRILGLLSLDSNNSSMIGFEEPENGVNPRRIKLIAEILNNYTKSNRTQIIATTHSPILLDFISEDSLYVCKRINGYTKLVKLNTWGELAKKPSTDIALDDESLPASSRLLRGDFDA